MNVIAIKALKDNYIWAMVNSDNRGALIVDPGEATPVLSWLEQTQITLKGILLTHHHWDHCNGVTEILNHFNVPVYRHAENQNLQLHFNDLDIQFTVIATPGHTLDHVAYFSDKYRLLFCGDTLFSVGCGRLFEGTAAQLFDSLQKLQALPDDTAVYCGHEYTLANLQFALAVEPNNADVIAYLNKIKPASLQGTPSLPSTIGLEKMINPFFRCHNPAVQQAVAKQYGSAVNTPLDVFTRLRQWKDIFKL